MGQYRNFKNDIKRLSEQLGVALPTKNAHYNRNDNHKEQLAEISYYEVITARTKSGDLKYKMLSDAKSYFHRFGTEAHQNNSKWVSVNGENEEYVFKYSGSSLFGQFALLTDDETLPASNPFYELSFRNLGTYNFYSSSESALHLIWDIYPWIKWGNSPEDNTQDWTALDRFKAAKSGFLNKTYSDLSDWFDKIGVDSKIPAPNKKHPGSAISETFLGTPEKEDFLGRGGNDTVSYAAANSAVAVTLERNPKQDYQGLDGWARGDWFRSIENLIGSDWGDILVGDDQDNRIEGGLGRDILSGRQGDDLLIGGQGIDTLYGNNGDDRIVIWDDDDLIYGGKGFDTVTSHLQTLYMSNLVFQGVELFKLAETPTAKGLHGTNTHDSLSGNEYDNVLRGWNGADILSGEGGNDTLYGDKGNDTFTFHGDWGQDVIKDSGGRDAINFEDRSLSDLRLVRDIGVNSGFLKIYDTVGNNLISVWNQFSEATDRMEQLITQGETLDLRKGLPFTGSDYRDAMAGTGYGDLIDAGRGKDSIYAYGGEDLIIGGSENDQLWGGPGDDTYIFEPGFGHDTISEEGRYLNEIDSAGDTIEMNGFESGTISSKIASDRMTISVKNEAGIITDSITIPAQVWNYGSGYLVEWIQFDDGPKIALTVFDDLAFA